MASNDNDLPEVVERLTEPKKRRRSRITAFGSVELYKRFEGHVAKAQNLFLQGDKDGAEREATLALRIRPTDHLFALLSVIAESKGQFDRASDFRLLQAFMANDSVLWEELLHEFLQEQLYYKSAVCLQRLSALETKDKVRYRTLQLQLADLYIGLGEFKRAANILVPLWNGSRCRDFETFALLSSLFFQLGRWNSLHRLIESSLKNAFRPAVAEETEKGNNINTTDANSSVTGMAAGRDCGGAAPVVKKRISKRVRFLGAESEEEKNDSDHCVESDKERQCLKIDEESDIIAASTKPSFFDQEGVELDDFDFSNMGSGGEGAKGGDEGDFRSTSCGETSSGVVSTLYGGAIEVRTPAEKRNFLTLVNVHAELLNEEGQFLDTIRLLEFTAGILQVPLLELPPDLLVRLGVAYAFMGGLEQQCREVFYHLVGTCAMAEYGDVLYDAANALQQVGMHKEAHMLFQTLRRYHEFCFLEGTRNSSAQSATEVDEEEMSEVRTVFAATLFAEARCEAFLGNLKVAHDAFCRVLEIDPAHLQARLALGRMYMYEMKDVERAIAILTPHEDEQPLDRIQLGAELVRAFKRAEKYVEAIALGVSIFELVFSGEEDGDTESIAPGSSRRNTALLAMPTLSRASSAIIPPSAISDLVNGPRSGKVARSVGRLSHTLATSIKASSAVFRSILARSGNAPLTNSVYGASAAASTAAGWVRADEEQRLKDSSTIFRFNRTRKIIKRPCPVNERSNIHTTRGQNRDGFGGRIEKEEDKEGSSHARVGRRAEEVTRRRAGSFWNGTDDDDEDDSDNNNNNNDSNKNNDTNVNEAGKLNKLRRSEVRAIKEEECDGEEFLGSAEELQNEKDDAYTTTDYELPSLEEVSKRFSDPVMQTLFIQASSNHAAITPQTLWDNNAAAAPPAGLEEEGVAGGCGFGKIPGSSMRITIRDALQVLGKAGFVDLAVTVIDCYSAIGKFTEAKEFAYVVLMRCPRKSDFRQLSVFERPLRWAVLRAALASKESEDAYRVGVRLLQGSCSEEERNQVLELLFGLLNRVEDCNSILLRFFLDRKRVDPPMLVLVGNRYFVRRSYISALNFYIGALQKRPNDIILCFLVGLSYMLISHQKRVQARDACAVAGWHYFLRYQELVRAVDERRLGEAVYNCARALQYFGLHNLAIPLYEQVAYEFSVPEQCTVALQRAARFNMYFTYRWRTGNVALALDALLPRRIINK